MAALIALMMIIGIAALVLIYFYNKLVSLGVRVKEGWSDILVQLKRRHDLINNLVETVKGYAQHESETLQKIIEARNAAKAAETSDPRTLLAAENQLTKALGGLNFTALAEAYPDLKANQNFLSLQGELSDTENKIAASRRFYNTTVSALNTEIRQFPGNLFASLAKVTPAEFFDVEKDEVATVNKAPEVNFSALSTPSAVPTPASNPPVPTPPSPPAQTPPAK